VLVLVKKIRWALPALIVVALTMGIQPAAGQDGGCFSVVVGKDVSTDGWVLMAHNEDDENPQIVNYRKIHGQSHASGETVNLDHGGVIPQASQTWDYLWSEMPGMLFSDSYLNEWGVCVCSDACPSREDSAEFTDGGIDYKLRRIVAERARTAREGVHIAGALIEQFGYASSGRTYIISDPNEGWLLCAVYGKHWAARRVPDDQVALIANTYTVHEIDLTDTMNYLAAPDVIDYAEEHGWYNPRSNRAFDFAAVYADPNAAENPHNIGRLWDGVRQIAADPPAYGEPLPFSVKPKSKIGPGDLMRLLRSHYEGTALHAADSAIECPHDFSTSTICNRETQTSFVAQLRGGLPPEIGLVWWACLSSPCLSCYVPFHFGIDSFPDFYEGPAVPPTQEDYQILIDRPFGVDETSAFWTFTCWRHYGEQRYADIAAGVRHVFDETEIVALARQSAVETEAADLMAIDRQKGLKTLADYSRSVYTAAIEHLRQVRIK